MHSEQSMSMTARIVALFHLRFCINEHKSCNKDNIRIASKIACHIADSETVQLLQSLPQNPVLGVLSPCQGQQTLYAWTLLGTFIFQTP